MTRSKSELNLCQKFGPTPSLLQIIAGRTKQKNLQMKTGNRLLYALALIGAAIVGGLSVLVTQWGSAEIRPTTDVVFDLIPVKLVDIAERDQWLLSYNIFFAPVHEVRTDSSYGLLVVMPKQEKAAVSPPTGKHRFLLNGYASNNVKPASIDGSYLARNVGKPEIVLLDFIRFSYGDLEGKTLVLQSMNSEVVTH